MAQIAYVSTASFCVENARELGIPAALLLDKIVRLSKATQRRDGFCWYTGKQFEEETSLSPDTFARAAKRLEDAGVVERKVTYIMGTMERATHFRLLPQTRTPESETRNEPLSSENRNEPLSVNTIKYYEDSRKRVNASSAVSQDLDKSSKDEQSSVDEDVTNSTPSPFDASVQDVATMSIRPDKDKNAAARRRQEFAILGDIRKHFGFERGGDSSLERKLVHDRLSDGWSKAEIIKVVAWLKENKEWYKDKTLRHCLGKEAFDEYQAANGTGNSSDFFAGMTDEQIHYWKMNHDPEYAADFERKVREAGNL